MFSLSSMCFRDSEDQHPCFSNSLSSSSWATHAKGLKSVMKADMVTNLSSSNVGSVTHCQPAWPPLWTWVCFAGSIHHAAIRRPKHLEPLKGSICGPRSKPAALVEVHPSPILWGLCVYGRKRKGRKMEKLGNFFSFKSMSWLSAVRFSNPVCNYRQCFM